MLSVPISSDFANSLIMSKISNANMVLISDGHNGAVCARQGLQSATTTMKPQDIKATDIRFGIELEICLQGRCEFKVQGQYECKRTGEVRV